MKHLLKLKDPALILLIRSNPSGITGYIDSLGYWFLGGFTKPMIDVINQFNQPYKKSSKRPPIITWNEWGQIGWWTDNYDVANVLSKILVMMGARIRYKTKPPIALGLELTKEDPKTDAWEGDYQLIQKAILAMLAFPDLDPVDRARFDKWFKTYIKNGWLSKNSIINMKKVLARPPYIRWLSNKNFISYLRTTWDMM